MSLAPGARLGSYEIVALIGAGGMGEVYRARDTKLNRDVALKVLPEAFAQDAERLARFRREAQVLASLNHPHIAAIYGLEESNGIHAIVMELVEGPTLAQRLKDVGDAPYVGRALSGPPKPPDPIGSGLPVNEALPIARQVADACQAAHEKGIVHRDLKPANIAFTADDQVKVLDFGLAKALGPAEAGSHDPAYTNSPTMSLAATRAGVILGTAAYMSPEQAKGRPADKRSDVWAFGVVLYEMLAGKRAFEGEDLSDTLANVLKADPTWSALPKDLPASIQTLLKGCLEKDRRSRIADISTALFVLKDPAGLAPAGSLSAASTTLVPPASKVAMRVHLAWLAAMVVAAVAGAAAFYLTRPTAEPTAIRFQVMPPVGTNVIAALGPTLAMSPDGRHVVFPVTGNDGRESLLAVRSLDTLESRLLPGTEGLIVSGGPFWSPDSRFIGFAAQGKLKKSDIAGGPPQPLCDAPNARGGTWNRDGTIVFAPNATGGLFRVSSAGGTPTPLTTLDNSKQEQAHSWPWFLPDGRHFLYVARPPNKIYVGSIDSPERVELVASDSRAIYSDGHLLFVRQGTLLAQPFDATRLKILGESFPVAEDVGVNPAAASGSLSASATGALAFRTGAFSALSQLVWFDRTGRQLGTVGDRADQMNVTLSPDDRRAAVSVLDPARNTRDIAIYDLARDGLRTRFTFDPADEFSIVWSPDGNQLVLNSWRKGQAAIYQKASSGGGAETLLLDNGTKSLYPTSWSTDGRFILYYDSSTIGNSATGNDVWVLPLTGDRKPALVVQTSFNESAGQISPDGRWIAYQSNESGNRAEVFVVPFVAPGQAAPLASAAGGTWQVSTTGGTTPRWRRDGKELFYLSADNKLMAAEVNGQGSAFQVGVVHALFDVHRRAVGWANYGQGRNYDVSANGQRILVNTVDELAAPTPITVVVNWTAGLRK